MRMRKTLTLFTAALTLFGVLALSSAPASAQSYFWWTVVDEQDRPYTGQNVQCSVFRPNIHAAIVLHNATLSSGNTNPLWSDASGRLHFYSASADPVDVACYYANGGASFVNKLTRQTHKIVIDRQGRKISRFSVNNTSTATNQSTGITLPQGAIVRDVIVQNLNPQGLGTYHLSVGFAGNHAVAANVNALISAQALTSPDEWVRPHASIMTAGGNMASHRGVALEYHINGMYAERSYMVHVASGLDVTYAVNPGTGAGARAHVYILWEQYHTGVNRLGLTN